MCCLPRCGCCDGLLPLLICSCLIAGALGPGSILAPAAVAAGPVNRSFVCIGFQVELVFGRLVGTVGFREVARLPPLVKVSCCN